MKTDLDNTYYCIFIRIRTRIRKFSNTKNKMNVSNSETYLEFTRFGRLYLPIFFIDNLQSHNHVKTKLLVHKRDCSLRLSHSSVFILIINHIINKIIYKYIF
jgi:hypothetical protein